MTEQPYWVYILYCENNTYYTGYTHDLCKRYLDHQQGKCKYTRSFKPLCIARSWKVAGSKSLAMQLEAKIKKLSHKEKEILIHSPERLSSDERVRVK